MANPVLTRDFSFRSRPIPVPGDLRIAWRVALTLLMLGNSRAQQASIAKLHILNDAIRSNAADKLELIVDGKIGTLPWHLKVEPAFARAMDFVVGDGLAVWGRCADRAALKLTSLGVNAFKAVLKEQDVLKDEKAILEIYAKAIAESSVTVVLSARKKAA